MKKRRSRVRRFIGYACIGAVWIALFGLIGFFAAVGAIYRDVKSPDRSHLVAGTPLEGLAQVVFSQNFWPLWQSGSDRAQFDPELIYVPKPGVARFRNPEFDTTITMSAEGLRQQPDAGAPTDSELIVVTGDSYAMGWGVGDAETFSAVLQQRHHHRTINAAVPSYGTARELLRLRRLGLLAAAKMLVIQYCPNDAPENHEFLQRGDGRVSARDPRTQWERLQSGGGLPDVTYGRVLGSTVAILRHRAQTQPLGRFLGDLARGDIQEQSFDGAFPDMAREFLAVIDQFPELAGKPILVTELQPFGDKSIFLRDLPGLLADRPNIRALTLSLGKDDYYRFDGHLRVRGHERVAEQLERAIQEMRGTRAAAQPAARK